MKKSFYIIAFFTLTCIMFTGCKKWFNEQDSKEDLSYLIRTYRRYDKNNNIYKEIWTYDGYRETWGRYYVNGQLSAEYKNYSYDGLNASWDYYSYNNYDVNDVNVHNHVECEYLDKTFRRKKYQKLEYYYADPQKDYIYEYHWVYDGKKIISYKSYKNGLLVVNRHDYNYNGLHCTYKETSYSSPNVVSEERIYDIVYLDDTYLRTKSQKYTRERYDDNEVMYYSTTQYTVYDYDGKKPMGSHQYVDGELSNVARDYQYDGLTCCFFSDIYRDGEVTSTQMYEVEYLE